MSLINRFDLDENYNPLDEGPYSFTYSKSSDQALCFKGNGNTSLTLTLNGVNLSGGIKIEKCKSITISVSSSTIIEFLTIEDCRDLSGSITFEIPDVGKPKGKINGNLDLINVDSYDFQFKDISVLGGVYFDNKSNESLSNIIFSGQGSIGKNLVFKGGSLADINIKGLDIFGGFKIESGAEISGRMAYSGEVIDNELKNFIKDGFEINHSVEGNLKLNKAITATNESFNNLHQVTSPSIEFEHLKIGGKVLINNQKIAAKFRLRLCKIEESQFLINTTFGDLADFYGTTFVKPVTFFKCDFKGVAVFSDATFNNNLLFTFCEFKNHLIFRGTKFTQDKDVKDSPEKPGLDLSTAILPEKVYFQYVELGYFDCTKIDVNDAARHEQYTCHELEEAFGITYKNQRDTFRIIKKYAIDNEDFYEVSDFGYLEAKAKQEMLDWEISKKLTNPDSGEKTLSQLRQDWWIHRLNYWSNRHRTSWWQSVKFIIRANFILIPLLVFTGLICSYNLPFCLEWGCANEYFMWFLKLFNPLHDLDIYKDLPGFNLNFFVVFLDIINRIVVGYGYYQFVQAFRRFK